MKIKILIPIVLFVMLVLSACDSQPATDVFEVTLLSPTSSEGYPAPQNSNSAYPAPGSQTANGPTAEIEPLLPQETPDPEMAMVGGVLINNVNGEEVPVKLRILYLAPIIKDDQGIGVVAALDRQTSPKTQSDANGEFLFFNVPPGEYGLILDLVMESFLLNQPDTEDSLVITIMDRENLELGELIYDNLPLPLQ